VPKIKPLKKFQYLKTIKKMMAWAMPTKQIAERGR